MNKVKAIIMGSVIAASGAAFAGGSYGLDVSSGYLFRGATLSDDVSIFPSLEAEIAPGLSVGAWSYFDTDDSEVEETDLYISYGLSLAENIGASIGYTEYTYPSANGDRISSLTSPPLPSRLSFTTLIFFTPAALLPPTYSLYFSPVLIVTRVWLR